jgi:hypothetical protein
VRIFFKRNTVGKAPTVDLWGYPEITLETRPSKQPIRDFRGYEIFTSNPLKCTKGLFGSHHFGAGIKKFISDSRIYLFGYHKIKHRFYLKLYDFYFMSDLNSFLVPCYLCVFAK